RGGVGRQLERSASPAQLYVRMVALRLGDERDSRDKAKGVAEVVEREFAAELLVRLALPAGDVGGELGRLPLLERGRPFLAGLAVLSREFTHETTSEKEVRERRDSNPRPLP